MLCSVSTGKSGSKWLDRLRSAKGFPAGNDLDLEQFLTRCNDELSNSVDVKPSDASIGSKLKSSSEKVVLDSKQTAETSGETGEKEWLGIMSNVLSELFYMGDCVNFSRIGGKKSSRKQQNPKICVLSTSANVANTNCDDRRDGGTSPTLPSSGGDNSCTEAKEMRGPAKMAKEEKADICLVDAEEDDKSHADLSGFSRTEVTVLDTSIPSWKIDKLLFRRKNVWKVRDKKGKSAASILGKKRKANPSNVPDVREKKLKQCSSSKDASGGVSVMPSNKGCPWNGKVNKDYEETSACQGSKKRFPRKSKKGGSSVVLIKNIPACNKKGQTSLRVV